MDRFPKNARVCFLGDSITHGNNFVPRIIEHYRTNLPELRVKFWNCGVSGGSAESGELYLADDVLPHAPTHVAIMLGVNDSYRDHLTLPQTPQRDRELEDAYVRYCTRMERLVNTLMQRGSTVILCTPAPYAEQLRTEEAPIPGGHRLIFRYAEAVRALAGKYGLDVVDYHARLSELFLDEDLYRPDHVHPNDRGHWRMAECFLRAQGLKITSYEPVEEVLARAGLTEWAAEVGKLRSLYASEWMIIGNYGLPLGEKMKLCEEYVAEKKWGDFLYFETLSKAYLEDKPRQTQIEERINGIMEEYYNEL